MPGIMVDMLKLLRYLSARQNKAFVSKSWLLEDMPTNSVHAGRREIDLLSGKQSVCAFRLIYVLLASRWHELLEERRPSELFSFKNVE